MRFSSLQNSRTSTNAVGWSYTIFLLQNLAETSRKTLVWYLMSSGRCQLRGWVYIPYCQSLRGPFSCIASRLFTSTCNFIYSLLFHVLTRTVLVLYLFALAWWPRFSRDANLSCLVLRSNEIIWFSSRCQQSRQKGFLWQRHWIISHCRILAFWSYEMTAYRSEGSSGCVRFDDDKQIGKTPFESYFTLDD